MSVMELMRNGGQMIGDVERLLMKVDVIVRENETLKVIVEKQGAIIVSMRDELGVVSRKLDDIKDEVSVSKQTAVEIKHTKFYGQTPKFLDGALEKVTRFTNREIRKLIHRAATSHPSGRRKGYTQIYNKLAEISGFDVYTHGQMTLKKSDGIEGWSKDASYINTILKHGKQKEVAVICQQILADK